ncbi:hypothetical protein COO20_16190 [Thalassospira marina]|uniref:Uncharacterized protein n=1 Tax=Thalassospira marina TaxID=2048283 RepID=A0A2N3KRT8_9PROT|nr:hypothetical protein COO20_16190 [Thalassospira marina]
MPFSYDKAVTAFNVDDLFNSDMVVCKGGKGALRVSAAFGAFQLLPNWLGQCTGWCKTACCIDNGFFKKMDGRDHAA